MNALATLQHRVRELEDLIVELVAINSREAPDAQVDSRKRAAWGRARAIAGMVERHRRQDVEPGEKR